MEKFLRYDHQDLDGWERTLLELALRDWLKQSDVSDVAKEQAAKLANRIMSAERVVIVAVKES